jgi:WhiB family transcriptional regulator, redox-sensing transcriptional regulator
MTQIMIAGTAPAADREAGPVNTRSALEFPPGAAGPVVTGGAAVVPLGIFGIGDDGAGGLDWQDRALCAQTDPEAFFPEKGGSTREAKKVCRGCEVRAECLEYALEHDERFGIWGGLSERERRRLKREAARP